MSIEKQKKEIDSYQKTKSDFVDFTRFEDDASRRGIEKDAFINDLEYTPEYKYPRLDQFIDDSDVRERKSLIYKAVMELEAAKSSPLSNVAELELFAAFHEMRLKRIMLVEAARNLCNSISMSTQEVNRRSFAELNEDLYGEFDVPCYLGMISTEQRRLSDFNPNSEVARRIKFELELSLGKIDVDRKEEKVLLDEDTLQKLHAYVMDRYGDVLDVVPDTPNDVYYNVSQCVEIINRALKVGGLAQSGWKAIENQAKSNPSTKQSDCTINLPSNTRRNASELRRLIIHEQEVHARRAQNGKESGLAPIKAGTANYADIEEGLGVILECAIDGSLDNPSFDRARNRYITAGLALGADGRPRDAREVFEILWRDIAIQESNDGDINEDAIKVAKNKAYALVENAYRGTQFWMKGVIYTKLKVYYEGFSKNADYLTRNVDSLDLTFEDMLIGKYDHTNPNERDLVVKAIASKSNDIDKTSK